jgi:PAS domain S-box-containing protein
VDGLGMDLSGYALAILHQDAEFVLWRGIARASPTPHPTSVLVSMPTSERPGPDRIRMLEHELAMRAEVDSTWAVRPLALMQHQGRTALILEDQPGEPLARLLVQPPASRSPDAPRSAEPAMELGLFLRLAAGLAAALGEAHRRGLIHKDVKPAHVLVNTATGQAWLTGFGICSRLPRERQTPDPPETIAGTLAYMAPEQTGRMNRSIDGRSDLYSLGVTLYEMLTGSLPFTAAEPIEWVHCHIARQPMAPGERVGNVSAPVSAIIMKLLEKTPEERYQTAAGLVRDLRRCLAQWEAERRIDDFPLGENDTPDRLVIPEKLYGRAREVETLLAAFDRVVQGGLPELVLVSGYSGVGKSSVVNELHKVLLPPRALFAAGKFEQYKRDIPYSTLAQAFQSLVRPLLAKSDIELADWCEALREALGPNGQLMVDLVPELRLIIGEPAPVPELPPQDAQRRFQLVLRRFFAVFARADHPLALFLDDLQWLDAATLDLLEDLLRHPDVRHVLLIGAYRDNEVTAGHPLLGTLDRIRGAGAAVHEIVLAPLAHEHVGHLVADALHSDQDSAAPLAEVVHQKTGGNPFFVIQFLSALAEEGLLTFDHDEAHWSWDLAGIHAKGYTDNVIDLMIGKLHRLPSSIQKVLQQLACLGNSGDLALLAMVHEDSSEELHNNLREALRTELVLQSEGSYRFLHDRAQEAAYSLIPEAQRAEAHLRIGRLLAAHTPPDKREEAIFEIVNQLDRASALISSRGEKEQLAEFNLIAGKRAKASTAYVSALKYLVAGRSLLSDDDWEHRADLMFALELQRAECEFLTGELAAAEARLKMLSSRAATLIDQATVACSRIDLYMTLSQIPTAIAVGLDCLRDMGVEWSPHPSDEEVRCEYERIWSQLGTSATEDLIRLPVLSDPSSLATLDILTKLAIPALATDSNLHVLVCCRAVNLSLERGNCDASCYAYVWLGAIAGARFGNYQAGYRFGRIGYELVEERGWKRFQPGTYFMFGSVVIPWARPVKAGRDVLRRAIEGANSIGDVVCATGSMVHVNTNMLAAGDHLADVERVAHHSLEVALKAQFVLAIEAIEAQLGFVRTLRGLTWRFGCFDSQQVEAEAERRLASNPNLQHAECLYWIRKMQARFFAGDYTAAIESSSRAQRLLWTLASALAFEAADYHLYSALSRAACCDSVSADERLQHLETLALHQRQLEIWAEHCPENFENRAALVGAEIARIEGRELDAEGLYEKAIRSACTNGFVHNEALANEVAARFYAARGFDKIARAYLRDASHGYLQWGADGKVRQLEERYPYLRDDARVDPTRTVETPVQQLDLATVLKVSQAVSGETGLEPLIAKVMRLALEHAGAERGLLILPQGEAYRIEAEARIEGEVVAVDLRQVSIAAGQLSESVLNYVLHTKESVLLQDASVETSFAADDYLRRNRSRSVLCMPLLKQARLVGVIYLENNLTPGAFTSTRMALLELLASEAATSLENASLYRDLQHRERDARLIVETIPALVAVMTPAGEVEHVNRQVLEYFGRTLEDLKKWGTTDAVHPADLPDVIGAWQHAIETSQPYEIEHRIRRADGQYRWFQLRGLPLRDADGRVIRWYVALIDIDERKQAEVELSALKDQLYKENLVLRDEVVRTSMFEEIVGTSAALQPVLARVARVARSDSTVLITGETGTGKELVARAIHRRSARASRAFVSVNCAAIPRELLASELFGHEKGAFTGATQRRLGRFEVAHEGTVFLDEVGELSTETQVALLRVLQEREFERVGGTAPVRVDVRVVAATNRDLEAAIEAGTFRSDLFYRLNVFPIAVPPLRERVDDIPLLVEYFIDRYARKAGKTIRRVNKRTLDRLRSYPWPGNVRELQNVIERSVIVCDTDEFTVDESWVSARPAIEGALALSGSLAAHEKTIIEDALRASGGRVFGPSGAAARLGIPRSTLESKIRALRINKNRFRSRPAKN